jgi:hypothetical protein
VVSKEWGGMSIVLGMRNDPDCLFLHFSYFGDVIVGCYRDDRGAIEEMRVK